MIVSCEVCGKSITITPSRLKNKHHTCSKVCLGQLSSKLYSKKIKVECQSCGNPVFYKQSEFKEIAYPSCSRICSGKLKSIRNKGQLNPKALNLSKEDRYFWERIHTYKRRAKCKNIDFNLDYLFLKELFHKQEGKCFYSNTTMKLKKDENGIFNVASLDRIDSSKGYIKGNVVFCLYCINMFKSDMNLTDFNHVLMKLFTKTFNFMAKQKPVVIELEEVTELSPGILIDFNTL